MRTHDFARARARERKGRDLGLPNRGHPAGYRACRLVSPQRAPLRRRLVPGGGV